jgi:integrase
MGVYSRGDSGVWWLYLEITKQRERTEFRLGTTAAQRRDSRRLAEDRYHQRMNEIAARLYKLPSAQPAIRFDKYAAAYGTDVIALRRGGRREAELLKHLVAFFGDDLLTAIDPDRVRAYMKARTAAKVGARTINREVDLLKGMLRDAAPKYLNTSPIVRMKRLRVLKPKRRLMTVAEERALLKVGDAQDRAILILGVDTMIRLGDLLDLERSDRDGPWLYVRDPKANEPYEVALSPRAQKALDAIHTKGAHFFAKFRKAKNPRDWPGSVRQRLEYLCRIATPKVPYGRTKGGITFHWATRRSGATRMLLGPKRVPLPVVQKQGNWKKPNVLLEIYTEARQDDQLKAVGSFPNRSRSRRKSA